MTCKELKENLVILNDLMQDFDLIDLDQDRIKRMALIGVEIKSLIKLMSKPLDWVVNAKKELAHFVREYADRQNMGRGPITKLGSRFRWKITDVMRDSVKIDIENRKIIIEKDINIRYSSLILPRNLIIKGNLKVAGHQSRFPTDLIVEGNVTSDSSNPWLVSLLNDMEEKGQIKGQLKIMV